MVEVDKLVRCIEIVHAYLATICRETLRFQKYEIIDFMLDDNYLDSRESNDELTQASLVVYSGRPPSK